MLYQPIDEIRQVFDVNVIGLLRVTQTFAPLLAATPTSQARPGRVINMSSMAGKFGAPFVGAYVGSKHAVEGLSESLRRELMVFGIDVVIIGPGTVVTAIWDKAEATDIGYLAGTAYEGPASSTRWLAGTQLRHTDSIDFRKISTGSNGCCAAAPGDGGIEKVDGGNTSGWHRRTRP